MGGDFVSANTTLDDALDLEGVQEAVGLAGPESRGGFLAARDHHADRVPSRRAEAAREPTMSLSLSALEALTMATMPARTAVGRSAHAATTGASSGSVDAPCRTATAGLVRGQFSERPESPAALSFSAGG